MKAEDAILRILQIRPNLTTFHLAKLSYLFDLACVQVYGHQCTDLPYKWWDFGPYCQEFDAASKSLREREAISIEYYRTMSGNDAFIHSAVETNPPVDFTAKEENILRAVVERFAGFSTKKLRDFVYKTPPMLEAQAKDGKYESLNMTAGDSLPAHLMDRDVAGMLSTADQKRDMAIPLDAFFEELDQVSAQ
jgi:uncharacterized phage-associated protein